MCWRFPVRERGTLMIKNVQGDDRSSAHINTTTAKSDVTCTRRESILCYMLRLRELADPVLTTSRSPLHMSIHLMRRSFERIIL